VYGTEFNVSAYLDDTTVEVVLVEGSVGVQEATKKANFSEGYTLIKPSQKASRVKSGSGIAVIGVDVKSYVAWKSGVLMFNNENIATVFKKLERQFNIKIQNNYVGLNKHAYTGIFKSENIEEILTTISAHTKFSYLRKGNTIIINNHK
jgi:ferric-dicitrate binding protein FerR (iron transport regulator)